MMMKNWIDKWPRICSTCRKRFKFVCIVRYISQGNIEWTLNLPSLWKKILTFVIYIVSTGNVNIHHDTAWENTVLQHMIH
jgi:hypothetical protein